MSIASNHSHSLQSTFLLLYSSLVRTMFYFIQVHSFLQPPMEGVVLQTYGAGNMPDLRTDLMKEFTTASERGVIIVNCTQCASGHVTDKYAAGRVS